MAANNSTDSWPPFTIYPIPYAIVDNIINLIGIFGNANIVIATFRSKNLRSKCNYLIAISAAFDFYTEIGYVQQDTTALVGQLTMPNDVCYQTTCHGFLTMNAGVFLIWMIGLDRLFAIKFSVRYLKWPVMPYLSLMVLPAIVYSVVLFVVGYMCTSPEVLVLLCMPPTAYLGLASDLWVWSGAVINVLILITYGWVFVLARKRARIAAASRRTSVAVDPVHRMTESLLIIMVIYTFGSILAAIVMVATLTIDMSPSAAFHISLYIGWSCSLGFACNYFIYFARSAEYAKQFRTQLICLQKEETTVTISIRS